VRKASLFAALLALCAAIWPAMAQTKDFLFTYVGVADDPYYAAKRRYTGLTLKQPYPPLSGAKVAIRDSRIIGRSLGVKFKLSETTLDPGANAAASIAALHKETGTQVFLLDLPAESLRATARELMNLPLFLFNIRNRDNDLREENCAPNLFHAVPSYRMLTDALAQFLFKKGWKEVLMLRGPAEADQAYADSFLTSARKMGLEIVGDRRFELTNDPRKREETNVALMTGGLDYDVIFIADRHGEFGRYVPYQTYLPRPLIGDEGLMPAAWHWTWERHGAPQLNQRFARIEKTRRMSSADWAAWASIKSVVAAIRKTGSTDLAGLQKFLTQPDTVIDVYKGNPASYRDWNNQLRQPILLHTHNAVVARAPVEGFLHKDNYLDTLGQDRPESKCAPRG